MQSTQSIDALTDAQTLASLDTIMTGDMLSSNGLLTADMAFALDMAMDPAMHGDLFPDLDLHAGNGAVPLYDHPDHGYPDDPMMQLLLQPPALADDGYMAHPSADRQAENAAWAQPQTGHPMPLRGPTSASSAAAASSSPGPDEAEAAGHNSDDLLFALPVMPSSPPPSSASSPSSPLSSSSPSPSPSLAQRSHRRRRRRLLSSSPSSSAQSAKASTAAAAARPALAPATTARRLPPRYPADPDDWRARLRYCEAVRDKGQLTAAMVRLLDFPEGLAPEEIAARRAGNLRLDRVREQRLKARNNSAAKRSRQRKVERIEAAEKLITALQRERAALQGEVGRLQRALAAATAATKTTTRAGSRAGVAPQEDAGCRVMVK